MALNVARCIPYALTPAEANLCKSRAPASLFPSPSSAAAAASSSPSSLSTSCFIDTLTCLLSIRQISPFLAPPRRRFCRVTAILLNPDFYHIPYKQGVPVGSKLKLFNLPYNCDPDALIQHFSTCGASVRTLKIVSHTREEGSASGYAVLGDLDQACAAVAQLDGARFQGKCVRMDFVERRPYRSRYQNMTRAKTRTPLLPVPKVFIGNLPWRVDSLTLEQLFSVHGTVKEAQIMRDKVNGRSLGYGFVEMSTAAEMQKAIAALDGCEVEGRSLVVTAATSR